MKLKKYSNMLLSIIILAIMSIIEAIILNINSNYSIAILILIINPILSALLGIVISNDEKSMWTLIGLLIITLLGYKEVIGFFNKNVLIYAIICLLLAWIFMITKANKKRKLQSLFTLSSMLILQFIIVSSIDFEYLEIMLNILILVINPILSIVLGIIVLKEKKLFWTLIGLILIPFCTYKVLFKKMELSSILIYGCIYLLIASIVIIVNKFIKIRKLGIVLTIVLLLILIITTIIVTMNKEVVKNIESNIEVRWYSTYTGIVRKIDEKYLLIELENYSQFMTNFSTLKIQYDLDATQLNVGDIVEMPHIANGEETMKVIEKDEEKKLIKFDILKHIYIYKKQIRLITDEWKNKLKDNEINLNQKINILLKYETLRVNL